MFVSANINNIYHKDLNLSFAPLSTLNSPLSLKGIEKSGFIIGCFIVTRNVNYHICSFYR